MYNVHTDIGTAYAYELSTQNIFTCSIFGISVFRHFSPHPQPVNANTNAIEKIANLMNARGHKKSFIVLWCFLINV